MANNHVVVVTGNPLAMTSPEVRFGDTCEASRN